MACGAKRIDSEFASVDLTEELVKLDGQIIDCYFNGTRWIFKKLNTDRTRAHTLHTIKGFKIYSNLNVYLIFPL